MVKTSFNSVRCLTSSGCLLMARELVTFGIECAQQHMKGADTLILRDAKGNPVLGLTALPLACKKRRNAHVRLVQP